MNNFVDSFDLLFIDTCSLLREDFNIWLKSFIKPLLLANKYILLPYAVLQELTFLAQSSSSSPGLRAAAAKAMVLASKMVETGIGKVCGDRGKPQQADFYLVKTCAEMHFDKNICVITQDRELCNDLHKVNQMKNAFPIITYKLKDGRLVSAEA